MDTPTLRPRRDGWTPAAQAAFLAARAGGASIAAAAAAAGLSRQAAYRLRAHPAGAAVRAGWRPAVARLTDAQVEVVLDQAGERFAATAAAITENDLMRFLRRKQRIL
jgi:hypothetical protein